MPKPSVCALYEIQHPFAWLTKDSCRFTCDHQFCLDHNFLPLFFQTFNLFISIIKKILQVSVIDVSSAYLSCTTSHRFNNLNLNSPTGLGQHCWLCALNFLYRLLNSFHTFQIMSLWFIISNYMKITQFCSRISEATSRH